MIFIITITLLLFLTIVIGPLMSRVETPKYRIVLQEGKFEVREYEPQIAASVITSGTRKEAINKGFRLLADYIFGNNIKTRSLEARVTSSNNEESEKIKMTAPVLQQPHGNDWTTTFILPAQYTLETLPKPKNGAVILTSIKGKKYAAYRFSGTPTDDALEQKKSELRQWIAKHQLKTTGNYIFAFYNPPWTLPALRRNEIMIELLQ